MVKMIAARSFPYGGHLLAKGAEFNATESIAKTLEAIGHATRRGPQTNQYRTRVLTAETTGAPDLDTMGIEELRALALRLGVKVHHRLGADKLRQALRNR